MVERGTVSIAESFLLTGDCDCVPSPPDVLSTWRTHSFLLLALCGILAGLPLSLNLADSLFLFLGVPWLGGLPFALMAGHMAPLHIRPPVCDVLLHDSALFFALAPAGGLGPFSPWYWPPSWELSTARWRHHAVLIL